GDRAEQKRPKKADSRAHVGAAPTTSGPRCKVTSPPSFCQNVARPRASLVGSTSCRSEGLSSQEKAGVSLGLCRGTTLALVSAEVPRHGPRPAPPTQLLDRFGAPRHDRGAPERQGLHPARRDQLGGRREAARR